MLPIGGGFAVTEDVVVSMKSVLTLATEDADACTVSPRIMWNMSRKSTLGFLTSMMNYLHWISNSLVLDGRRFKVTNEHRTLTKT